MHFKVLLAILVLGLESVLCAESLTVASWNIRTTETKVVNVGDEWELRAPHVRNLIELYDFDVLGLQEATKIQIDSLLRGLPQYDFIGVAARDGKKNGSYSPIFFKKESFEVLRSGTFWLSETPNRPSMGWDTDSKRICTWAIFRNKVTGTEFAFFNTHLDHKGKLARQNGSKLILDSLKLYSHMPVFFTGDFNVSRGSALYDSINASGIVADSYLSVEKKYEPSETFNRFTMQRPPDKTIDFIFVNKYVRSMHYGVLNNFYWEYDKPRLYSDHYPVQLKCVMETMK